MSENSETELGMVAPVKTAIRSELATRHHGLPRGGWDGLMEKAARSAIGAMKDYKEWRTIDTAPLAQMVWLWHPMWRHAFPGQRNGDNGECYIDTCEPQAKGWQGIATHWMPMSKPPTQ